MMRTGQFAETITNTPDYVENQILSRKRVGLNLDNLGCKSLLLRELSREDSAPHYPRMVAVGFDESLLSFNEIQVAGPSNNFPSDGNIECWGIADVKHLK